MTWSDVSPALGLIPAHAGKTLRGWAPETIDAAHPRSRGENSNDHSTNMREDGSSPLTRGKQGITSQLAANNGLIPAHAGKTARSRPPRRRCRAHPRSRGENSGLRGRGPRIGGSSPLTRGKPRERGYIPTAEGLIPAHAGKTGRPARPRGQRRAHPRSRGENVVRGSGPIREQGSSPLTRGKLLRRDYRRYVPGLIPAHAGKTRVPIRRGHTSRAHPRSRGENALSPIHDYTKEGSSPLTRGKRAFCGLDSAGHRLIPAHAGKTRVAGHRGDARRAHPRSRGENTST